MTGGWIPQRAEHQRTDAMTVAYSKQTIRRSDGKAERTPTQLERSLDGS